MPFALSGLYQLDICELSPTPNDMPFSVTVKTSLVSPFPLLSFLLTSVSWLAVCSIKVHCDKSLDVFIIPKSAEVESPLILAPVI